MNGKDRERRARRLELLWWSQLPVVCAGYWFLSSEPAEEKAILVYLAAVSIIALAVSYGAKGEAARAEQAASQ